MSDSAETTTMTAFTHGQGQALRPNRLIVPAPGEGQVRLRTRAVSFNNADLEGGDPGQIGGYEFSGDVEAVGAGVDKALVGRHVMGTTIGAFAEHVLAHHRHVIEIPSAVSYADAAALPTALLTEHGALTAGGFQPGATVLITAGTSSIGLVGIQIAKALGAAMVIATTRSAQREAFLRDAGADLTIATDDTDLVDGVLRATNGSGADVTLDHVGGQTLSDALAAAALGGTVVNVGRLAGSTAEVDLSVLWRRQVALRAVSYGFSDPETIGRILDGLADAVLPAVADGRIKAVIDRILPFEDAQAGLDRLAEGTTQGKVVLTLP